jgi:hypothetical protein
MKKGVKPVARVDQLKILGLRPYKIMQLARSTCPLIQGRAMVAQSMWIW